MISTREESRDDARQELNRTGQNSHHEFAIYLARYHAEVVNSEDTMQKCDKYGFVDIIKTR